MSDPREPDPRRQQPDQPDQSDQPDQPDRLSGPEQDSDRADEMSEESFPASDPPSTWAGGTDR